MIYLLLGDDLSTFVGGSGDSPDIAVLSSSVDAFALLFVHSPANFISEPFRLKWGLHHAPYIVLCVTKKSSYFHPSS